MTKKRPTTDRRVNWRGPPRERLVNLLTLYLESREVMEDKERQVVLAGIKLLVASHAYQEVAEDEKISTTVAALVGDTSEGDTDV